MSTIELDHLVVAARTLEQGIDYIQQTLGVTPTMGGSHARHGTHNALVALGAGRYLEIIAIDPKADPVSTPRWFALDLEEVRRRIDSHPCLLSWVARTDSLEATAASSAIDLGPIGHMSRGSLHWRMTFAPNGNLLHHGLIPPLIQWDSPAHPTDTLPDVGCRLRRFEARHPDPRRIQGLLETMGLQYAISVRAGSPAQTGLRADIETPQGLWSL